MDITLSQASRLSDAAVTSGTVSPQARKIAGKAEQSRQGGDTVSLSEEGMEKSASLAKSSETAGGGTGTVSASAASVDVKSLEEELRAKENEIASTEAEIEELTRQAADDPTKKAQLSRKKQELSDLQDGASAIQVDLYA